MYIELSIRWEENNRGNFPEGLENISQVFESEGFKDWFTRDGSVIHKNIQRLTSESEIDEREEIPLFTEEEFTINTQIINRAKFSQIANEMLDDFQEDFDEIRKQMLMCVIKF